MDLRQEAVGNDLRYDLCFLQCAPVEPARFAVAVGDPAEAVEVGIAREGESRVEERHPGGGEPLPNLHADVLAGQSACRQRGVGRCLTRDPRELVARVEIRPVGPVDIEEFGRDVEEPGHTDGESEIDVGAHLLAVCVARTVQVTCSQGSAYQRVELQRVDLLLEHDVDHPGDGVGAVLRRRAVPQHLDPLDRGGGYRIEVDAHRTATERPVDVYQGARVPALAVDQDQHLIGSQPAETGRIDVVCSVTDGLIRRVERRCRKGQDLIDLGLSRLPDLGRRYHVHWHGRLGHGPSGSRTGDHDLIEQQCPGGELEVQGHGRAGRDGYLALRSLVADEASAHDVHARGHGQHILTVLIRVRPAHCPDDQHGGPGQCGAVSGGHRPADHPLLRKRRNRARDCEDRGEL